MRLRVLLGLGIGALLLAGAVAIWRASHAPWRARQVVLITIDTLRFDRLGVYGYRRRATSPRIDRWAETAVVFDHATSVAPWTVPSLSTVMTGRYPAEVGAYTNFDALSAEATTLAELFQAHGFATASFNTHALLVNQHGGFRQGFDTVYPTRVTPTLVGEHKAAFAATEPHLHAWLEQHAREPFFLWVHDMDPHLPPTEGNPYLTKPGWRRYDAELRWMDEAIGRLLDKLHTLGLGDDLLIIFTADHGEAFGDEHGLIGHQDVMYDEVLRVPLIVQFLGMGAPRRIAAPVALIDLFPTIAELAGLPLPGGVRGASLVPVLTGVEGAATSPYAFHTRYFFEDGRHWLAVRDHDWKLLARTPDLNPAHDGDRLPPRWDLQHPKTYFELYRTADDPGEIHDLFEQHPETVSRLGGILADWGSSLTAGPQRPVLDDATRESLRALGYDP